MSNTAIKAMIKHAILVRDAAVKADEDITSVLKGLLGACQSKTGKDEIDVSHLDLFVDPRSSSTEEDKISGIGMSREDEDENIVAYSEDSDSGDDYETHFEDLLLETRVALVNELIRILKG